MIDSKFRIPMGPNFRSQNKLLHNSERNESHMIRRSCHLSTVKTHDWRSETRFRSLQHRWRTPARRLGRSRRSCSRRSFSPSKPEWSEQEGGLLSVSALMLTTPAYSQTKAPRSAFSAAKTPIPRSRVAISSTFRPFAVWNKLDKHSEGRSRAVCAHTPPPPPSKGKRRILLRDERRSRTTLNRAVKAERISKTQY